MKQKKSLNDLSLDQKLMKVSSSLKKPKKSNKKLAFKALNDADLPINRESFKSNAEPEEVHESVMEIDHGDNDNDNDSYIELKSDEEASDESTNENELNTAKQTNARRNNFRKNESTKKSKYSLFIGNLTQSMTDSNLQELVQTKLSPKAIKVCKILRRKDGQSKGIAYLEVTDEEALNNALELNGLKFRNHSVLVARNDKVLDRITVKVKNTLYITKIKAELTDGKIIQFLEKSIPPEEIVRFDRIKTERGIPTGTLILEVASEEALQQIKSLDGSALAGKAISVKMFRTSLKWPNFIAKPPKNQEQMKKKTLQRLHKKKIITE